jgi:hypothetical protein
MLKKMRILETSWIGRSHRRVCNLLLHCRCFLQSSGGVSTVEWVALAAGLVIGSIVVSFIMMQGLAGAANSVANQLSPSP